jgi:hypothetical protein
MNIRQFQEADHEPIIVVVDDWFDGRQTPHLSPKIFFVHFGPTSFAIEEVSRPITAVVVSDANSTQHFSRLLADLVARWFVALLRR